MSSMNRATFPRIPLIGATAMIVLALGMALMGQRVGGFSSAPAEMAIAQRDLIFSDRADGAVLIRLVGQSEPLSVVTGQAGFLRGILRALARERRQDKLERDVPFRLSAWPDGRLTLDDMADGRRIELEAFGRDNAEVFARLLALRGNAP